MSARESDMASTKHLGGADRARVAQIESCCAGDGRAEAASHTLRLIVDGGLHLGDGSGERRWRGWWRAG